MSNHSHMHFHPFILSAFLNGLNITKICFIVSLLKLRLENAAALKLKGDRVSGMSEVDVALLRTEIKVRTFSPAWEMLP